MMIQHLESCWFDCNTQNFVLKKTLFRILFEAFHAQNHFHVFWKFSYFDAYDRTSLKWILLSQRSFS